MLCQSLSNYKSIEFIAKLLSRKRQQQKCFPKTEWRKVKTEKKEILHFIASSMVDVETMFKLSIVLWEKAKHNTTTTLTSTSCPSDNQTKSENLLFWTVIMVMRRPLLSFFEMILLLEMNLTHMVVVIVVLRDAAMETIALCTFCTYETFARNRVKIVGYEQSGHF